jgi:hypothetical protein
MKCTDCGKEMKEEVLFVSVSYSCECKDGWFSLDQIKEKLSPLDRPVHLKFKDENDATGSAFIGNMDYFDRCPKGRLFKVSMEFNKELEYAKKLYGYSIVND